VKESVKEWVDEEHDGDGKRGLITIKDKNTGFNPCGQTLLNKQLQNPTLNPLDP
jgi:hypothetical protein